MSPVREVPLIQNTPIKTICWRRCGTLRSARGPRKRRLQQPVWCHKEADPIAFKEEHVCVLFLVSESCFFLLFTLPDTPLLQYFCAMLKKQKKPCTLTIDVPK